MVHPPPTPAPPDVPSTNNDAISSISDAGNNQKEILFIRGKPYLERQS